MRPFILIALLLWPVQGLAADMVPGGDPPKQGSLSLSILPEKILYRAGDTIILTLQVFNEGSRPAVIHFRTAQRYDLVVEDSHGRQVWRWAKGRMFAQVLGEEVIAPSGLLSYQIALNQPLPPGYYKITGLIPAEKEPLSSEATIQVQ